MIVVEHDTAGTERYQLSLLRLDEPGATLAELEPLVRAGIIIGIATSAVVLAVANLLA